MTRNEMICREKENGATLKEIGTKYGISRERVRQICLRAEQKKKIRSDLFYSEFVKYGNLGSHIINVFKRNGITTKECAIDMVTSYGFLDIRNLGAKSIRVICEVCDIPLP